MRLITHTGQYKTCTEYCPKAMEALDNLHRLTGITNKTYIVERAIQMYEIVVREQQTAKEHGAWVKLVGVDREGNEETTILGAYL